MKRLQICHTNNTFMIESELVSNSRVSPENKKKRRFITSALMWVMKRRNNEVRFYDNLVQHRRK